MPPGPTLNPATGAISGTPTAPGTFKVTDSLGNVGSACSITINSTTPPYACVPPGGAAISGAGTSWNKFNSRVSMGVVSIHAHIGKPSGVSTTTAATPSSNFDSTVAPYGQWVTTLNQNNLYDEIFFERNAVPVDSNITGGGKANFTYTTNSTDNNLAFSWQWSSGSLHLLARNNQAEIVPYHQSLHAGTPLNTQVEKSLIQGPRGGGSD